MKKILSFVLVFTLVTSITYPAQNCQFLILTIPFIVRIILILETRPREQSKYHIKASLNLRQLRLLVEKMELLVNNQG